MKTCNALKKKKRKEKPKKPVVCTRAKLNAIATKAGRQAVKEAFLIFAMAMLDEGVTVDQVCDGFKRADRYADHIEDKLISLDETEAILKANGIEVDWK